MEAQKSSDERRRYERTTVLWAGQVLFGAQEITCVIVNISPTGALVRTEEAAGCPASITLRNPRIGDLTGEVAWRKNNEMGIRFLEDENTVAAIIGSALS